MVADESHNLKNKEAKRTSVALPFLKSASVSLCLTGLTRNPLKINHMHMHVHVDMHIHIHIQIQTHTDTDTFTYTYTYTYIYTHTHTNTNTYRYRHVHIHIYIYTHTHTHTDIDTLQNVAIYLKNRTCVDLCSMQLCILLYPSPSPSPLIEFNQLMSPDLQRSIIFSSSNAYLSL